MGPFTDHVRTIEMTARLREPELERKLAYRRMTAFEKRRTELLRRVGVGAARRIALHMSLRSAPQDPTCSEPAAPRPAPR